MTVKSKTINFIFVLDLIFIDGFVSYTKGTRHLVITLLVSYTKGTRHLVITLLMSSNTSCSLIQLLIFDMI
jgi:hypothetical protein